MMPAKIVKCFNRFGPGTIGLENQTRLVAKFVITSYRLYLGSVWRCDKILFSPFRRHYDPRAYHGENISQVCPPAVTRSPPQIISHYRDPSTTSLPSFLPDRLGLEINIECHFVHTRIRSAYVTTTVSWKSYDRSR